MSDFPSWESQPCKLVWHFTCKIMRKCILNVCVFKFRCIRLIYVSTRMYHFESETLILFLLIQGSIQGRRDRFADQTIFRIEFLIWSFYDIWIWNAMTFSSWFSSWLSKLISRNSFRVESDSRRWRNFQNFDNFRDFDHQDFWPFWIDKNS